MTENNVLHDVAGSTVASLAFKESKVPKVYNVVLDSSGKALSRKS